MPHIALFVVPIEPLHFYYRHDRAVIYYAWKGALDGGFS